MEPQLDIDEALYQFRQDNDTQKDIAALRAIGPAPWVALPGGIRARAVVHPELLRIVARHTQVSKDAGAHWPTYKNRELPKDWPLMPWVAGKHAFSAENSPASDNHRRLREPLDQALHRRQVEAMRPRIEQIVTAALGRAAEAGTDPVTGQPRVVDLRALVTLAVPIQVISDLLGIPEHLGPAFQQCADNLFDSSISRNDMLANQAVLQQTLEELIAYRAKHPGEDLTSTLLSKQYRRTLSLEERMATVRLIIVAAIETVGNLMGSAILNLLTHPEALTAVRSGQAAWDDVIDETLRHDGPAGAVPLRFATRDIAATVDTDNGPITVEFQQGVPILPVWAAAGRHPDNTTPDPDAFDVLRTKKKHLAFGHGPHYCAGADLAVAQTAILLPALFDRFPGMTLAVDRNTIGRTRGFIGDGPHTVPVLLGPVNPGQITHGGSARRKPGRASGSLTGAPS
ncbi:cytochrome P450 [Promicromonospora sp. MS192]|uniref:cytochrome P450 n=1 Tax=Promicromonospora sp. MS192 TaxID=3412684 RepID=UPI003C2BC07C